MAGIRSVAPRGEPSTLTRRAVYPGVPIWLPYPSPPRALGPLAGILAAHPRRDLRDPAEAVRLAERLAGQVSFQEPRSLDLLGAALAAAGDFTAAIQAADRAATLATTAGANELVTAISQRLALYRAGRPYVGPLPAGAARRR